MGRPNAPSAGREGFEVTIAPTVANAVRRAANDRGVQIWRVAEETLTLGLPLLAPVGEALPHFANDNTRQRGHDRVSLFVMIGIDVANAVRDAAASRHAHVWWAAQEAFKQGLPLLPAPTRVPALNYDEELRQSA